MGTQREEVIHFTSTDTTTHVRGVLWWPDAQPRGIVQLVHGMAEHIMRYEPFAHFLNEAGYLVCGHDHVGHGHSVESKDDWGCLPLRGGRDVLVGDVGRMRDVVCDRMGTSLPYFLFGHSMGSFVVRAYISECGTELTGAIICGTAHIPPIVSAGGNLLAHLIARMRGERYVSKLFVDISVGAYSKGIEKPRTSSDWLSYNATNVDAFLADEQCGFAFSAGGNATLTALTGEVCTQACCARVPHGLPLLYVAGDADPVGDMGKGVHTAVAMAKEAGSSDVTCIIYDHMRHEILNEDKGDRVMRDICTWMEERL